MPKALDMKPKKLPPIHPGEILREEFMLPRGLSQNALARALHVSPRRINEIVLEKRGITADTALRVARFFGTSAEMWTGLQSDYDLRRTRYEKAKEIDRDVAPFWCRADASNICPYGTIENSPAFQRRVERDRPSTGGTAEDDTTGIQPSLRDLRSTHPTRR